MVKSLLLLSFLCLSSFLGTATCLQMSNALPNGATEQTRYRRSPVENSSPTPDSSPPSGASNSEKTNVVQNEQKLLGVNGTGQRKDYGISSTSSPVLAATISTPPLNYKNPYMGDDGAFTLDIDEPEEAIDADIAKHNQTKKEDYHVYYNSSVTNDKELIKKHRAELGNMTISNMLSHSYRRAMTIKLSFDFPFYGHKVRNITVATGGFLYTGEHVHSWLAATQYIAPLMANFDTSKSNNSFVKYSDNGTAFTVLWENVNLQDTEKNGTFTFSATLYKNGDITFAYYSVPVSVEAITSDKHPVKVGLSDAYIIDRTIFFARRKTIYEYHRINFEGMHIENGTLIYLQALDTCLNYTDCQTCVNAFPDMNCMWCPTMNRCSTGTDRRRQEWLHKGCETSKITQAGTCPKIGEKGNDYKNHVEDGDLTSPVVVASSTASSVDKKSAVTSSSASRINNKALNLDDHDRDALKNNEHAENEHHEAHAKNVKATLGFLIPLGLILTAALWAFYAYRNPHSKSGQFLIQYRPSQWGWRRGEAHYTAAVQQ
ncbi:plexin domain-containing protein 2 [Culicoides brevitarsis]|uniref:plexin domain-containing protein 2 n=1 Tax=Culicoides brevitarsis TaxID=469753 RepID=UPI00307B9930